MGDNIQTNTTGRLTPCLQKKIDKTTTSRGVFFPFSLLYVLESEVISCQCGAAHGKLYNHYKVSLFSLLYVLPVSRNIERDTVFRTVYQTAPDLLPCPDRHLKVRQTRNQDRLLFFLYPEIFPAIIFSRCLKYIASNHRSSIVKGIFIQLINSL